MARRIALESIEDLDLLPTVKFSGRKMVITFKFTKEIDIPSDDPIIDPEHPRRFTHRDILEESGSQSAYGGGLKAKLISMKDVTMLQMEMKLNHKVPGTGVEIFRKNDEK